jgi:hypothetical protein
VPPAFRGSNEQRKRKILQLIPARTKAVRRGIMPFMNTINPSCRSIKKETEKGRLFLLSNNKKAILEKPTSFIALKWDENVRLKRHNLTNIQPTKYMKCIEIDELLRRDAMQCHCRSNCKMRPGMNTESIR